MAEKLSRLRRQNIASMTRDTILIHSQWLASTIHNFDTFSVRMLALIVNRYITSY